MEINVNTFKHPADCECNKPSIAQTPSPSEIATMMALIVLRTIVVLAAAFFVVYVLYSFITA